MEMIMDIINKIHIPNLLLILIVGFTILIANIYRVNYFSIIGIIKKYFEALEDQNKKINGFVVYIALILPIVIALYLVYVDADVKNNYDTVLLIVTILTALFFSVFGIIFSMKDKLTSVDYMQNKSASTKVKLNKLVNSVLHINMFEITISIFILMLCFFSDLTNKSNKCMEFIIYYLIFVLFVNMFVLLKRLDFVLSEILEQNK